MLTRPPLAARVAPALPLDLHVLGTPPAFNLSQDQTLHLKACDLSSDDQILNNSLLAIEYSSSICASQTTDASPHTNYLFNFLKSDLHARRRQKRNYNRDFRFVNFAFGDAKLIFRSRLCRRCDRLHPRKAAQFNRDFRLVNS